MQHRPAHPGSTSFCESGKSLVASYAQSQNRSQIRLLDCVDVTDLHGGLLALSELSLACKDSKVTDPSLDGCVSDVSIDKLLTLDLR